MDKTNAMLYEAKIHADENRSKEVRHFSASVVEAVEELQGQLHDADESLKAVERALKDVDYSGTYADGVEYLKRQLAEYRLKYQSHAEKSDMYGKEASQHEDTIEFATEYALNTVKYLHQHFYADVTQWKPLDDLIGLQTQISNMVAGIGEQLAAALAAIESKDENLGNIVAIIERLGFLPSDSISLVTAKEAIAIKPDASALRQHDEALIERCAEVCEELFERRGIDCAAAIRELKGEI